MCISKLSAPLPLEGKCFKKDMEIIYQSFYETFIRKETRPEYHRKFIFFNLNQNVSISNGQMAVIQTFSKPERFLHIVSLEEKKKYLIDPCVNDDSILYCKNECNLSKALPEFRTLNRSECYYRLSRIHRIAEVLELANNNDADIQEWTEFEYNQKREKIYKAYIRYRHKKDDYIVILKEDRKSGILDKYYFITAFPLFDREDRKEYDYKYAKFISKK